MRPTPARWFELLTSREDLGGVLDCLARTGLVQLETYSDAGRPEALEEISAVLEEFVDLERRYADVWPQPQPPDGEPHTVDVRMLTGVIGKLRDWAREAEPLIAEGETLAREHLSLGLIHQWLGSAPGEAFPHLQGIATAGPALAARLYALPPATWPTVSSPSVLLHKTETDARNFVLAVGPARQVDNLDETMRGLKARCLEIPPWLRATREQAMHAIEKRRTEIDTRRQEVTRQLDALANAHELPTLLAHMRFLRWVAAEVPEMTTTEHFAWVTGWTSDLDGSALQRRLEESGLDHLIRFPPAPERAVSPMILRNPAWARAFEMFSGLMGTPAARDVDPSVIVAVVAPLMFGYMFGDVGQGAVLVVAGLLLKRRFPPLALLIPGGAMAILFGVLFGTVFANEAILPALWLHPLDEPLPVLAVALGFGIAVITLGIVLDAVQATWAGHASTWWQTRAGMLVGYLGLLGAVFEPALLWLALAGVAWFVGGEALHAKYHRLQRLGAAIVESIETLLQLLVNTVSFIRIGAFALAHAGLSVAVMGIAEAFTSTTARLVVYLVGNLFILFLEGLVVGIQATRLVLFEFFIRFLRVEGRAFRPLCAPGNSTGKPS